MAHYRHRPSLFTITEMPEDDELGIDPDTVSNTSASSTSTMIPSQERREGPAILPGTLPVYYLRVEPQVEEGGLEIEWDHFTNPGHEYEELGAEALFKDPSESSVEIIRSPQTGSITTDLEELKKIGYNIQYPNGLIGSGFFGAVYKGYYGKDVINIF